MHKHRWAVFAAAFVVAGVAVAAAMAGPSRSTAGKTFYFIPKDTLNPYEVIADRGGKIALTELGNKQVVQSGTEDTAAAQQPCGAGRDPGARGRNRDRRQRSRRALPGAQAGAGGRARTSIAFDSDVNCRAALHQPGRHRDDRPQPDRSCSAS